MEGKIFYLVLLGVLSYFSSVAQTIINAENLIRGAKSSTFSFDARYSGSRGNSNTNQFQVTPSFVKMGKVNQFKFLSSYKVLTGNNQRFLNSGFIHLRHHYVLYSRLKTDFFYQLQFNEVLLLQKRELVGGGIRLTLLNNDSISNDLGVGVMHEYELLDHQSLEENEKYKSNYLRLTFLNSFVWRLKDDLTLSNVTYYQPYLLQLNDFRILNDIRLAVNINKHISLLMQLEFRFDSDPPSALTYYDLGLSAGLNMKWD